MPTQEEPIQIAILKAVRFAADRHRMQRRKDVDASPYINHPIAVAETLAAAGVEDRSTLLAAILHDVIEDTETEPDELRERFGDAVARIVEEVTDDKSLTKEERKRDRIARMPHVSPEARLLKLADLTANCTDVIRNPPKGWSPERREAYLAWARAVAEGCRGLNPTLDARFDAVVGAGG